VYLFVNFFCKHYYYDYDWNTIQGRIQGSSKCSMDPPPLPFASDRPLKSLDKLLKCYLNLKSVCYPTMRFYNKTVTVTSLYWKPGWKLCCTALIAISASKIIIVIFHRWYWRLSTGSILLGSEYLLYKILNLGLWKLRTRNWSHHVPTTKLTPFMVNKDEWDTKEGPGKSMKNGLDVQRHGKKHLSGWSDIKQRKSCTVGGAIALAIVKLRKSEGIEQAGNY